MLVYLLESTSKVFFAYSLYTIAILQYCNTDGKQSSSVLTSHTLKPYDIYRSFIFVQCLKCIGSKKQKP
jgi:hypothetical protein